MRFTILKQCSVIAAVASCASAQCLQAKLTDAGGMRNDKFGFSVAALENLALVGDAFDDEGFSNSGSAWVFEPSGNVWSPSAQLTASDCGGLLGRSVAARDGLLVLGADALEVRLFERVGSRWVRTGALERSDDSRFNQFGWAVGLGDGTIAVGAPRDDGRISVGGAVYVYERDTDGLWSSTTKLFANNAGSGDMLGIAVAADGNVIVAGADGVDDRGFDSGAAYVYERRPNGVWRQVAEKRPDPGANIALFGHAVAVRGDVIAVGSPQDDTPSQRGSGAAYVYERQSDGRWLRTARLAADDAALSAHFGSSVAIDGDMILVGARDAGPMSEGAAYVFERNPAGGWSQLAKLTADDSGPEDQFGHSVALAGHTAVIGAWHDDDNGRFSGSAYVFAVGPDNDGNGVMDICECPADLNRDGRIDVFDLTTQLAHFGTASGATYEDGDIDLDGDIDVSDLALLLAAFGSDCP